MVRPMFYPNTQDQNHTTVFSVSRRSKTVRGPEPETHFTTNHENAKQLMEVFLLRAGTTQNEIETVRESEGNLVFYREHQIISLEVLDLWVVA